MFSSNQKFSVNGEEKRELVNALKFAFDLDGHLPKSYMYFEGKVLFYTSDVSAKFEDCFPVHASASVETLAGVVFDYLKSGEARKFFTEKQDDLDGSTYLGWHVFVPTYKDAPPQDSWSLMLGVKHDWIYYAK